MELLSIFILWIRLAFWSQDTVILQLQISLNTGPKQIWWHIKFKSSLHYWQSDTFFTLWKLIHRKLGCLPFESHNTAYFLPAHNQISNDPIRCDLWGKGRNPTQGTIIFIGPYTGIAEEVTTHVVIHRISRYFLAAIMKKHYVIFYHDQCESVPQNSLLSLYCTVSLSFILQVWN